MPPTSHALMDLIIALSAHLPRSSYQDLFALAGSILPRKADPQLQKKAYKLLPRLASTEMGRQALQERSAELQELLLSTASSASVPARRDRLAALATVVDALPPAHLHFVPAVLSEVVLAAKEVNERARTAAFDLLIAMAGRMQAGGVVAQSRIPGMPADAPDAPASLEEFLTMVSAGLAGTAPHMVSASINALTRLAYEFRAALPDRALADLTATLLLFLDTNDREVARSALGFAKLAAVGLPDALVRPHLPQLVPGLARWSREHHNKLRARVKHLFERLLRRFGYDAILQLTPEDARRLVHHIQQTKDKAKRRKDRAQAAAPTPGDDASTVDASPAPGQREGPFEAALDNALAESDDEASSGSDSDSDAGGVALGRPGRNTKKARRNGEGPAYIVEDEDEPLDLLDRAALAHIARTRPVKVRPHAPPKRSAPVNADGKLVIAENGDGELTEKRKKKPKGGTDDAEMRDDAAAPDADGDGGVGAYVAAVAGRDAVQRGQRGRLKFSNRKTAKGSEDVGDGEAMDVDIDGAPAASNGRGATTNGTSRGGKSGAGGGKRRPERRGLDGSKVKSAPTPKGAGRVVKAGGRHGAKKGGRR